VGNDASEAQIPEYNNEAATQQWLAPDAAIAAQQIGDSLA
jgi:hypothetical protein